MSKSMDNHLSRIRVADNFIKSYGRERFRELLNDLEDGVSLAEIGRGLAVSRERVRQWKNKFGIDETVFYPSKTTLAVIASPDIVHRFPSKGTAPKTQIRNFVLKRGIKKFQSFISDLIKVVAKKDQDFTGETMAQKYKMSRERVRQLKKVFGTSKYNYNVYSDVNALRR